jgi:ATP/maltotriose-dependent transcriptional regulator MalT
VANDLALVCGSIPASVLRERLHEPSRVESERSFLRPLLLARLAILEGDLDAARQQLRAMVRRALDRGHRTGAAIADAETGSLIELLSGDPAAAEGRVRAGIDALAELGETAWRCCGLCIRADALILLGDIDEVGRCVAEARAIGAKDDIGNEFQWRRALARLNSLRGEDEQAQRLGREALAIALETEATLEQAETHACLAEVLARAGQEEEAADLRDRALELCQRKEAPAYAAHINRRLDALIPAPA